MLEVKINEDDKKTIAHERYYNPHAHIRRKMEVLHLKSLGLPHHLISTISGVTPNTMLTYFKEYVSGGLDKIRELKFYRPKSDLQEYEETIKKYFDLHPPSTLKEAATVIESLTGIKRSLTQIGIFLKKKVDLSYGK